ncbi:hypothetical protein KXV68_001182 [Aspergillus fumigatus]|nr:hypothetical protein KXV48_004802 [Aspergillus fumigatus]KAH2148320.1 hypothetical protein KXV68_001182 [Aspergillus fumigatus]KAH2358802.1 hypothetical protein KXW91_006426 [Aspergillus fumigatus]
MSEKEDKPAVLPEVDDDEPDEWDKRIFSTGCAAEQDKMNDCYFTKKDWRLCKDELRFPPCLMYRRIGADKYVWQMEAFRECWKRKGNDQRTQTKDA